MPICHIFEGRIDKTLKKKGYKSLKNLVSEEHICMLREPGSSYVGYVSPKTGSSKHISEEILELLTSDSNSSYLRAIGCDGTNVNTGITNGVIVGLERALKSPLQWIVCQLNANELPIRHLNQKLDCKTNGPAGFSGGFRGGMGGMHPSHQPKHNVHMNNS